jgi:hypothetical protein
MALAKPRGAQQPAAAPGEPHRFTLFGSRVSVCAGARAWTLNPPPRRHPATAAAAPLLLQVLFAILASLAWMAVSSGLIMLNADLISHGFPYPFALSGLGMSFSSVASFLCCRVGCPVLVRQRHCGWQAAGWQVGRLGDGHRRRHSSPPRTLPACRCWASGRPGRRWAPASLPPGCCQLGCSLPWHSTLAT